MSKLINYERLRIEAASSLLDRIENNERKIESILHSINSLSGYFPGVKDKFVKQAEALNKLQGRLWENYNRIIKHD